MTNQPINISLESVIKITAFFLALYFCYLIKSILFILLVSVIVVLIMKPAVDWFERKKVSRVLGALAIYLALFAFLALVTVIVIPPLAKESAQLGTSIPHYFDRISESFISLEQISENNNLAASLEGFVNKTSVYLEEASINILSRTFSPVLSVCWAVLCI